MALKDFVFNVVLYATTAFYSTMGAIVLGVQYLRHGNAMVSQKFHPRPKALDKWKHGFLQLSVG